MTLGKSVRIPLIVVIAFWLIELFESSTGLNLDALGIYPRSVSGLIGIVFSPFLHGSFEHLASNSISFILLLASILFFYPGIARQVIWGVYLTTGIGVWLFARPAYHIGASGLIYGFAGFLFFFGVFRKDTKSLNISLLMAFLYHGMLYGVFPNQQGVSWESHFIGALSGASFAYMLRGYKGDAPPASPEDDSTPSWYPEEGYRNIEGERYKYEYKEGEGEAKSEE